MQTEPVERQVSTRPWDVVRGAVAALAMLLMVPVALHAETSVAHSRPRARQTMVAQTEHARSTGHAGKAGTANATTKHRAGKGLGEPARSSRGGAKTLKPEAHARLRSRRHAEPVDDPEPVVLHRAKGMRGRATRPVEVVSRSRWVRPARTPVVASRVAVPRVAARKTAATEVAADAGKSLTVDDFMKAAAPVEDASTASGKTYVRGESRTEADDRISDEPAVIVTKPRPLALKPVVTKPLTVARVEANPPVGALPAVIAVAVPPEDLAGQPLVASSDVPDAVTTRRAAKAALAPLPLLSRQQVTEEIEQPVVLPGLYRNGRLVVPAPLKGTHEILVHQNLMADDEGLERVEDDYDLRRLRAAHLLVDFPESASLHINPELAADRRCGRVWSVRFATNIARDFYARFHQPLQVNSAVRTVAYQVRLQRTNGNAAGIDGDTASPHLTGQAMDLGKRNMSMAQIAWMRSYLLPLMQAGKVDVEEEFQQACFHISVYRTYMPAAEKRRAVRNDVAQLRESRSSGNGDLR